MLEPSVAAAADGEAGVMVVAGWWEGGVIMGRGRVRTKLDKVSVGLLMDEVGGDGMVERKSRRVVEKGTGGESVQ